MGNFTEEQRAEIQQIYREERGEPWIGGDPGRLHRDPSSCVNNALFNLNSGHITVGKDVMFGFGVELHAGTHDIRRFGRERFPYPSEGCDIVVEEGAAIFSRALILGPCTIGKHAVVAAGAVVKKDVPPYAVVAGNPALVKYILPHWSDQPPEAPGLFLHWGGLDQVPGIPAAPQPFPIPVSLDAGLVSEKGCFFYKVGWYGWLTGRPAESLGGWWLPLPVPSAGEWSADVPTETGLWWHRPEPGYVGADSRPQPGEMLALVAHSEGRGFYVECGSFFYHDGMSSGWTNSKEVGEAGGSWTRISYPQLPVTRSDE